MVGLDGPQWEYTPVSTNRETRKRKRRNIYKAPILGFHVNSWRWIFLQIRGILDLLGFAWIWRKKFQQIFSQMMFGNGDESSHGTIRKNSPQEQLLEFMFQT